jgi:hypothetical protein
MEKKIPSIQQFLSAKTPQAFQALAGGKSDDSTSALSQLLNLF